MSEQSPNKLPDGNYEASEIEESLENLPPEMQKLVRNGISKARQERESQQEAMQLKSYIAEFAIASHINANLSSDNYPAHVNEINWSRLAWDLSEMTIRYAAKGLPVEMPDSLKKAVAYSYAANEFARDGDCEEVDELLIPFGYPTARILDDLTEEVMTEGRNNGYTRDEVREKLSSILENIELWGHINKLEPDMRRDLKGLGYQLPELEPDNSYGYSEERGEHFPKVTLEMLPTE